MPCYWAINIVRPGPAAGVRRRLVFSRSSRMGALEELSKQVDTFRRRLRNGGVEWVGSGGQGDKGLQDAAVGGVVQTVAGGSAFVAVLALSQIFQGMVLKVSSSSPLGIPTAIGFATVAAASVTSLRAAEAVLEHRLGHPEPWKFFTPSDAMTLQRDEAAAGSFGLVLFRALGGRFSSIAPSALHMPGAFSRLSASLPATLEYASDAKRQALASLGKNFGCHTCGTRVPNAYIADHMPPLKIVKLANAKLWRRALRQTVAQRFYPQCQSCSTLQSAAVRSGSTTLKYHAIPGSLRRYHAAGALLVLGQVLMVQSRWQGDSWKEDRVVKERHRR